MIDLCFNFFGSFHCLFVAVAAAVRPPFQGSRGGQRGEMENCLSNEICLVIESLHVFVCVCVLQTFPNSDDSMKLKAFFCSLLQKLDEALQKFNDERGEKENFNFLLQKIVSSVFRIE